MKWKQEAIGSLRNNGWTVEGLPNQQAVLPPGLALRYPDLPCEFEQFVTDLSCCVGPGEATWLLCPTDYRGETQSAFAWNEFELMSLEAAGGDSTLCRSIRTFWSEHLPITLSVGAEYAYCAIRVTEPGFGTIVSGHEPEFEDATVQANTFREFVSRLASAPLLR